MTIERQAFTFTYRKTKDDAALKTIDSYDEKQLDALVMGGQLDAVINEAIYYDINQHSFTLRNIIMSPPSNIDIMAIHPSYQEEPNFNVIKNIDAEKKSETNDVLNAKRRFYLAVKKSKFNLRLQSEAVVTDMSAAKTKVKKPDAAPAAPAIDDNTSESDTAVTKLTGKFINDDGHGNFVFNINNSLLPISSTFSLPEKSDEKKDNSINFVINMPRYVTDNMQGFNDSKRFNLTINTFTMDATLKKSYLVFAQYAMPDIYVGMTLGEKPLDEE